MKPDQITHRDLMLATSTRAPFSRPGWLFEPKYDGYRILAEKQRGAVRLLTRNGIDLSKAFPELVVELEGLPDVVIDGELVALDEKGKPHFDQLRGMAARRRRPPIRAGKAAYVTAIFAFDLLSLSGEDVRALPLIERKAMLKRALKDGHRIRYLQHVEAEGQALYQWIVQSELEGIVAKRADAPYRAGRTSAWLKVKTPAHKAIEAKRLEHKRRT